MSRFNIEYHLSDARVTPGAGEVDQVARYVAMGDGSANHWKDLRGRSAVASFVFVHDEHGHGRRVCLLTEAKESDPTLPILVISAGGNGTWLGAGSKVTNLIKTAIAVLEPGSKTKFQYKKRQKGFSWNLCLGAWRISKKTRQLVALNCASPKPVEVWQRPNKKQRKAYRQWIKKISGK